MQFLGFKLVSQIEYKRRLIIHRKPPDSGGSGRSGYMFAEMQDFPLWERYDENPE